MDIQWVIIADTCKVNIDRSVDILKIRHCVNTYKEANTFPVHLILKANFSPLDVSEYKIIKVKVVHEKNGEVMECSYKYKVPDLETWADSITYIDIKIDAVKFLYEGNYDFNVYINGEYKNTESLEAKELRR